MACAGCFSGCSEITPDKCVRYTGADITALGISNGDNLLSVEQKIIQYLLTALDGSGIDISIDAGYLCTLVTGYLGGSTKLDDIIVAIIRSLCDLESDLQYTISDITSIEASYTVTCLSGVTASSGTHDIVQAIITKLCALSTSFTSLVNNLPTTYVAISDLNTLIQDYLDSVNAGTLYKEKMIPYVAYPYFQSGGANFSVTGIGLGNWAGVYLCNGLNGTPDLRGRVLVATTTGMGGGAFDSSVDPNIAGNPSYSLYSSGGVNDVTLSLAQIPTHSHATTVDLTDAGHFHSEFANEVAQSSNIIGVSNYATRAGSLGGNTSYEIEGTATGATLGKTGTSTTGITVSVTNPSQGSGKSHTNIQPVIASSIRNYLIFPHCRIISKSIIRSIH